MKRSILLIISFFLFFTLNTVLFIIFQKNELFMLSLNRDIETIPSPLISDIFEIVFYGIIFLSLIVYIVFATMFIRKSFKKDYPFFKKIYNTADFFSVVPIFLFVVVLVNGLFFSLAQVDGESMQPNFCDNDTVVISYNSSIERNDILIIKYDDHFIIKKVVGLPGDKLVVNETGVYINDVLIESYLPSGSVDYDIIIPDNNYYALGDNRLHSLDSRIIGIFTEDKILGEVIYKLTNSTCG